MSTPPRIVVCRCEHYRIVSEAASERITQALDDAGVRYESTADLCGMAATRDSRLEEWADGRLRIIACFPRAIKWLFGSVGVELNENNAELYNARSSDIDEIIASITALPAEEGSPVDIPPKDEWIPWFPVIDHHRCTNCKQCYNFCLFGVYALSEEGKVQVVKPQACKTNCPACARVCPQKAVIFPKYADSPINGDEVDESMIDQAKDESELEKLLGGNIHEIIRKRKAKKLFARAEDADARMSPQQKLERLAGLKDQLGIPQEVLDNLSQNLDSRKNIDCPNADICSGDCEKDKGVTNK